MCRAMTRALRTALADNPEHRYEPTLRGVLALTRLAAGHKGVWVAIQELSEKFYAVRGDDRTTPAEWERMTEAVDDELEAGGLTEPADKGCCSSAASSGNSDGTKGSPPLSVRMIEVVEASHRLFLGDDNRPYAVGAGRLPERITTRFVMRACLEDLG